MSFEISYGKMQIPVYRTYAAPAKGVTPIPESAFTGKENTLFALTVDVEVFGDNFLPAYTEGDNSNVVATDTMKNFVLRQALLFRGSTLEGFLLFLGEQFLGTYPQMQRLRVSGREEPFLAAPVPAEGDQEGGQFAASSVLFSHARGDHGTASLDIARNRDGVSVVAHSCGREGLQLIKVTGSSFAFFARDQYTTLPERRDRPLYIYLDVAWKYGDAARMVSPELSHYVASEQVRDLCQTVFHRFVSMSIQHLVHEMGVRLLERFPQMAEVSFTAQNRLWDTVFTPEEGREEAVSPAPTVYTDPRPPFGLIKLTLRRDE